MLDRVVVVRQVRYCALFRMKYCTAYCADLRVISDESSVHFIFVLTDVGPVYLNEPASLSTVSFKHM